MSSQAVFDIEADNINPSDVTQVWCIVLKDLDTEEVFKYGPEDIQKGVEKLRSFDRIVGHNILSYDLPVLDKLHGFNFRGQVIDTLILSRLANPDRRQPWGLPGWHPHSIESWAVRLGGQKKVEHNDWSQYSPEMLHRCEVDVNINEAVYKALYYEFKE